MANERPRWWQTYAHQEFMTPGVEETLEIVAAHCRLSSESRVLEVACAKGEAACRLAQRFGCRVVGIDYHAAGDYAAAKARARLLSHAVSFVRADAALLPVAASSFDVVLCTGGPSIIGTTRCMEEIRRALRPGGTAVVSDWVWRNRPPPPEARPRWINDETAFTVLDEYAKEIREAGFAVLLAQTLPEYVWYGYYAPMLEVIEEMRRSDDPAVRARAERSWSNEPQTFFEGAGREYWGYAVFVARKLT